jgi:hypothetical protein
MPLERMEAWFASLGWLCVRSISAGSRRVADRDGVRDPSGASRLGLGVDAAVACPGS